MSGIGINDFYFLVLINLLLLLVFYKSKFPRYIFLFLLVALSFSYIDMADYEGYLQMYEAPKGNSSGEFFLNQTDIGFRIFVYLGNYLKLRFDVFKAIIYFIFGIILIKGLIKLNEKSTNIVLSLYLFYPLILDLVQLRHFMAMSSFIYAIAFFIESIHKNDVKFKNYLYFFPSLIFHNAFVYLIILVLISYFLLNYICKRNFLLKNLILLFLSYISVSLLLLFLKLGSLSYFTTKTSFHTVFFYFTIYFIFYFFLIRVKSKIKKNENLKTYNFLIIYTTLLMGTTLPLIFYHVEFFRYFRVELLILMSFIFSITLDKDIGNIIYSISLYILYVFLAIIIFYVYYLEDLIFPLLLLGNKS